MVLCVELETKQWEVFFWASLDPENLNEYHKEGDKDSPDEEAHLHWNSLILNIWMLQILIITEETSLVRGVARASYQMDIEHGDGE